MAKRRESWGRRPRKTFFRFAFVSKSRLLIRVFVKISKGAWLMNVNEPVMNVIYYLGTVWTYFGLLVMLYISPRGRRFQSFEVNHMEFRPRVLAKPPKDDSTCVRHLFTIYNIWFFHLVKLILSLLLSFFFFYAIFARISSPLPWTSLNFVKPAKPRVLSKSARVCFKTCSTPAWPATIEPYSHGRPTCIFRWH